MTRRDRIIMMKIETPKRLPLPHGRTSVARYKRVTRAHLPANIRLKRLCRQRAVPWGTSWQISIQWGRGLGSNILKFVEKVIKTPIVQELGTMALNELPYLLNKGTNKIKNKKIKKLLQSDLENTLVDMGTEYGQQKNRIKRTFYKKNIVVYL